MKKMNQVKTTKKSVESKNEETKSPRSESKNKKKIELVMTFDAYFQGLMSSNPHVLPHHKAPMRSFAKSKGINDGTKEQFDRVFQLY